MIPANAHGQNDKKQGGSKDQSGRTTSPTLNVGRGHRRRKTEDARAKVQSGEREETTWQTPGGTPTQATGARAHGGSRGTRTAMRREADPKAYNERGGANDRGAAEPRKTRAAERRGARKEADEKRS